MIIFMGIAGSGKGTQSKLFADEDGYEIISTGELLRTYGSEDQHKRMMTGEILGDDEVTALLDKALRQMPNPDKVLLDGYPRRLSQANWLLDQQGQGRFKITHVIHLLASRETVKSRLQDRARLDDHHKAIEERFNKYEQDTVPILEHFARANVPILEIDAERSIDDVHQAVMQAFRQNQI